MLHFESDTHGSGVSLHEAVSYPLMILNKPLHLITIPPRQIGAWEDRGQSPGRDDKDLRREPCLHTVLARNAVLDSDMSVLCDVLAVESVSW